MTLERRVPTYYLLVLPDQLCTSTCFPRQYKASGLLSYDMYGGRVKKSFAAWQRQPEEDDQVDRLLA